MTDFERPFVEADRTRLSQLIVEHEAQKEGWIRLHNLWFEPSVRHEFACIVGRFLLALHKPDLTDDTVVLCPEGTMSSFGMLPIASWLASELTQKGYSLAIWRELGDVITTEPKIFPLNYLKLPNRQCVVLQDVVRNGTTLRKMRDSLALAGWTIIHYVAAVKIDDGEGDLGKAACECIDVLAPDYRDGGEAAARKVFKFIIESDGARDTGQGAE